MSAWGGDPAQTQLHRSHLSRPGQTRSIKITLGRPGHPATLLYHSLLPPVAGLSRVQSVGARNSCFNYCCTIGATRSNRFLQLLVKHSAQHGLQGQETANKQTYFFFSPVITPPCLQPAVRLHPSNVKSALALARTHDIRLHLIRSSRPSHSSRFLAKHLSINNTGNSGRSVVNI